MRICLPITSAVITAFLLSGCTEDTATESCPHSFSTSTEDTKLAVGTDSTRGAAVAQSFQIHYNTFTLKKVHLRLISTGLPVGTLTLHVQGSIGTEPGVPNGITLASGSLSVTATDSSSNISPTGALYAFALSPAITLAQATKYWLRLQWISTASTPTDSVFWSGNNANGYTPGIAMYETTSPGVWSRTGIDNWDLLFKLCEN